MAAPRFIMIGGFLGAGKTTTVARLADHYRRQGLKVGIVTNDQAPDLVDTFSLRSQGFNVGEVPGSCFCCNFNALTAAVESISQTERPDVILAEPVGSCTDIVATVVRPLTKLYGAQFDVRPYGVILKPNHGGAILRGEPNLGFSDKAAYIFRKQLEEADFVIINRIDELPPAEVEALARMVEEQFPGRPIVRMSAKTGAGFDALLELLDQRGTFGRRLMELDYDVYAEGEAELGWLNSNVRVTAAAPFALDELLIDLIDRLAISLEERGAETAHLKTIGLADGAFGVANLTSGRSRPELSLPSGRHISDAQVVINARVATDPQTLQSLVSSALAAACRSRGATAKTLSQQSFRPGRPVPTHRILEIVA